MNPDLYLEDVILQFRTLKELADKAVAQVADEDLFRTLGDDPNSIAIIRKHLAGNMRSRWTDFLSTDGEKPDRHRDREFELGESDTRASLDQDWDRGWASLFAALDPLGSEDLDRTVFIRGEPHTVPQAIHRQLTHYAYHIGQIVQLARFLAEGNWKTLSIPRGESEAFNRRMRQGTGGSTT